MGNAGGTMRSLDPLVKSPVTIEGPRALIVRVRVEADVDGTAASRNGEVNVLVFWLLHFLFKNLQNRPYKIQANNTTY